MTDRRQTLLFLNYSLNIGGIETLMLEIAKRIDRDKYTPMVGAFVSEGKLRAEFEKEGIPVHIIEKREGVDLRLPLRLAALLREAGVDIVHTQNQSSWLYGAIAARLAGVRLVHTVHTCADYSGRNKGRWMKTERLLSFATKKIATVADSIADFMVEKEAISREKIRVIHNGVDVASFAGEVDPARKRQELGIAMSDFVIGNVARLYPNKSHGVLIEAFRLASQRIPLARLLIAGDGPCRQELEQMVAEKSLGNRVGFLGNRRDISELMKAFDLFALSSRREGFPVALLEAMASGLAVVATRVDGNSELVMHNETGILVPPEDPAALAEAIIELYSNYTRAREMGIKGKERISNHFTFEAMVKKYEKMYEEVVSH